MVQIQTKGETGETGMGEERLRRGRKEEGGGRRRREVEGGRRRRGGYQPPDKPWTPERITP